MGGSGKVQDLQSIIQVASKPLENTEQARNIWYHMLSLSDDKRTGESAKSQRGLFPQKLLRNKLRIAVGNEIIKFQVGKFESSMKT